MPTEMPTSGDFQLVRDDLVPLEKEFGAGAVFLPDGFDSLIDLPMANETMSAIPWEFHVDTEQHQRVRGDYLKRSIVITGTTIVQHMPGDAAPLFWRFVDWSAVWAQLGTGLGRGEYATSQRFLNLNGDDITD